MNERLVNFLPQICMILFALLLLYLIPQQIHVGPNGTSIGPRFFPNAIAVAIIIFSLFSLLSTAFRIKRGMALTDKEEQTAEHQKQMKYKKEKGYKHVAIVLLLLIAWAALMPLIGFAVTTFLTAFSLMYLIGNRKFVLMFTTAAIASFALYAVAKYLLHLSIDTGILF